VLRASVVGWTWGSHLQKKAFHNSQYSEQSCLYFLLNNLTQLAPGRLMKQGGVRAVVRMFERMRVDKML
jgi:hypothetical protein